LQSSSLTKGEFAMYVCPTCKRVLKGMHCVQCPFQTDRNGSFPVFFTSSPLGSHYRTIGLFYDALYQARENAWKELDGRGSEFISYMASLVESFGPTRYLDVGCGQGYLLGAISAPERFGIEISRRALESANGRSKAELCQGIVEELPYPTGYFDVVTGVGVMEHFLDVVSATKEIHRVLRTGGTYILLLYIPTPLAERILIKVAQFIFPQFHPGSLVQWVLTKLFKGDSPEATRIGSDDKVTQPIQNKHTYSGVKRLFQRIGFKPIHVITKRRVPDAPLVGHHFRIYILCKQTNSPPRS